MWISTRLLALKFKQPIPYGIKQSSSYKSAKRAEKRAKTSAFKLREKSGLILDGKNNMLMNLRQNTGINWYRAKQILKHLEMHIHANPVVTPQLRQKIVDAAEIVKRGG
ncbi:hypothetical protein IE077_003353 [Cardiosporidium cionae]|uniref:Uncharacterized protein n=1 Tax=Cardiosporidium cionae TaxID=476202 RepID=A0ABQ7J8G2_9APIC|nr:hypothetical protein IE077_003353 [Cardiosporidium cionae]|eukprot:KAF8820260.1 hypothetical protein IE077_003353 [Cardiosporidium cionae]